MSPIERVREHMNVVGADGAHVGTVDRVEGDHIKLTRRDSPETEPHYIDVGLVADVEDDVVWLSANGEAALTDEAVPTDNGERRLP